MKNKLREELKNRGLRFAKSRQGFECARWADEFMRFVNKRTILSARIDGDYQGLVGVVFYDDQDFVFLEWSWGSCPGCDPYEDADDEGTVRWEDEFKNSTKRFATAGDLLDHIENNFAWADWLVVK